MGLLLVPARTNGAGTSGLRCHPPGSVEAEVTTRLKGDVHLRFDSYPLDLVGGAQTFRWFVASGVAVNEALATSGLLS